MEIETPTEKSQNSSLCKYSTQKMAIIWEMGQVMGISAPGIIHQPQTTPAW
jgi:hypothetical protein